MRIVVDARKAADYGIGTYIRQLGGACARLAADDEFVFLGSKGAAREGPTDPRKASGENPLLAGPNVTWQVNQSATYGLAELFSVSLQARRLGADVFHSPHYVYPYFVPCPGVVTVHDCIHLRFPRQLPHRGAALYARRIMRHAVKSANRVLTVSEATRADLVELVNADPKKIVVIPHGCDPYFLEPVDEVELESTRARHGLERPFLLCVTNIKPHKNLKRLIRAVGQLAPDYRELELVIAGGGIEDHADLAALCREVGVTDRVRTLGFLPKAEVRALYHLARIFVFPSLYEGFGLPPLEAMACGTPVVAARSSAIPEVVGRCGLLVNPYRVDAIAEAIRSLLENDNFRKALGTQGRTRAERFDWDHAAQRVLDVYREVGSS